VQFDYGADPAMSLGIEVKGLAAFSLGLVFVGFHRATPEFVRTVLLVVGTALLVSQEFHLRTARIAIGITYAAAILAVSYVFIFWPADRAWGKWAMVGLIMTMATFLAIHLWRTSQDRDGEMSGDPKSG
jgi:hypothetical protein